MRRPRGARSGAPGRRREAAPACTEASDRAVAEAWRAPPPACIFKFEAAKISSTHVLTVKRGIVLCWACGAYSAGGASPGLRAPCRRPDRLDRGPKHVLARWAAGLTPRSALAWPEEQEEAEDRPPALLCLDGLQLAAAEPQGAAGVQARLHTPRGLCSGPNGARRG